MTPLVLERLIAARAIYLATLAEANATPTAFVWARLRDAARELHGAREAAADADEEATARFL